VNWHFDDLKIDLYVADTDHNLIKEFTNSGTLSKTWGSYESIEYSLYDDT
jgi:hypothetical protein